MKSSILAISRTVNLLTASSLVLAGCAVGPEYKRPELVHPQQFRGAAEPADAQINSTDAASFADLPWWQVFSDPALHGLINQGLNHNYDLAAAAARIEQARALLGVSRSEGQPQLGYEGSVGAEKTFVPLPNAIGTTKYFGVGGALKAAWELDLWGRIRHSNEAAQANVYAQEEVQRGIMLALVSDIASGYYRLLTLDRELAIAEESNRAYKKILDLFTDRFKAGKDSQLPVDRTQGAYDSSAARIADLKVEIGKQENALSILVGGYPQAIPRGLPITQQARPNMPLGLTTDLIRRRPDIRKAEQMMIQANAEVGVAVANFYPRFGLGTLLGGIHVDAEHGISGSFGVWKVGLDMLGTIFSGGRLESELAQKKAFWTEMIAGYQKTVTVAFQETSDALIAQQNLVARRTALESQVGALRRSVDNALLRYDAGRASYFEVLEAQQQLFPAEDELARTQRGQMQAMIDLYKALGGGWNQTNEQWNHPS